MKERANTFKALAEPIRLRMLRLLLRAKKEVCVCELVDSLKVPQYAVSRHIKELEREGLVKSRRDGKWVYYSSARTQNGFTGHLFQTLLSLKDAAFRWDESNLQNRLKIRQKGKCVLGVQNKNLSGAQPQA